jgi:molybdate transport system permease protein
MVIQNGDYLTAGLWVAIILLISFGIVVVMNLFADAKMKHIKKW